MVQLLMCYAPIVQLFVAHDQSSVFFSLSLVLTQTVDMNYRPLSFRGTDHTSGRANADLYAGGCFALFDPSIDKEAFFP